LTGDVVTRSGGTMVTGRQAERLWAAMPLTIPLVADQAPDLVGSLIPGADLRHRAATFTGPESPWFRQLCASLDAPFRANLRQDRLFSQVTIILKAIAAERRLLLILEDLHYADPASISLLFHLSLEIGDCPILLSGTYRPEEIIPGRGEEKHPLANIIGELKRQHGDIWLDLGQTTTAEGQAFVDAYLDTEPNRLDKNFRSALFVHTGGHALFTVELLRALKERGELVRDEDGRWLASEVVDWNILPAKVEGVIEQRLGRLDADLQSALAIASVEGETFTAEVVAKVQKGEESQLVRRLSGEVEKQHRLVQADTLAWAGTQRLSRYRFRHQLFQQYLYQSLDHMERAYLHEDVGRALEGLYGPEAEQAAVRLSWHFEQAGLAGRAIDYLTRAARQAVRLGANDQVVEHCTRGLALLKTVPDSAKKTEQELALQIILGNALIATKGYGSREVKRTFSRAHELCRQVGQTPQLSQVLFGLWGYYFHQVEYRVALELGEQALHLAQQQIELGPLLNAHRLVGVVLFYLGEFGRSLEHMEQVISDYDPELHSTLGLLYSSDPGLSALSFAALNLMYMGYPDQALAYSQRALQLARELSNPFALAFTLLLACWLRAVRMDPKGLLKYVEEQISLTSEHGFPLQQAMAKYHLNWARGMSGEAAESIPRMRQSIVDWQATGAQCGKSGVLGGLAMVCLEAGQTTEGLALSTAAIDFRGRTGERYYEAEQYWIRGELLRQQGASHQEVEAEFQQAIKVARQLNARLPELQATIRLGRFWQRQGKEEKARQALAEIYGWFTEGFDSPDLLVARQLLREIS
jgi:tetratricopeptide (TPR) repeat protein